MGYREGQNSYEKAPVSSQAVHPKLSKGLGYNFYTVCQVYRYQSRLKVKVVKLQYSKLESSLINKILYLFLKKGSIYGSAIL